jgi:hypothetical protein
MSVLSVLVASPSSGATRHLLPDGEKNVPALAPIPLPIGERWLDVVESVRGALV